MMKRVSHLKFTLLRHRSSEPTENGDLPQDFSTNEIYSEGEENSTLNSPKVNEMCTASKTKRNILKTLRWKWRKKRGSLGLHDLADSPPGDDFGNESPASGTLRGFVPKKLRSKIPKSGTKRAVCPSQCTKQNEHGSSSPDLTELDSPERNVLAIPLESNHDCLSLNCINHCGESFAVPLLSVPSRSSVHENPRTANLTRELFKLSRCGWYWGPVTRNEAEEKLLDQPDGAFLVRDSSDDRHLLSISFRSFGRTLHTRIEHCNGMFSFYAHPEPEGHSSIVELIEQSIRYSQSGVFCYSRGRTPGSPSYPVRLTKPMSRFNQVRTLQYLCRFVIRQYTRFDHIQKLPLPGPIKGYLEEGHY